MAQPTRAAPAAWRADPLSRPTIILSDLAPQPQVRELANRISNLTPYSHCTKCWL